MTVVSALTNAIEDASAPSGVRITEQYLPPTHPRARGRIPTA
jgi:hypothetical protein